MSRDNKEEVNQGILGYFNRASILTFRSYEQSQGGMYECRVAAPGNYTECLLVCIGEGQGDGCGLLSIIALCLTHLYSHILYIIQA